MKPCMPELLPIQEIDWAALVELIAESARRIAEFNTRLSSLPNSQLFLTPMLNQEAVLSARIEGTRTTVAEVYEYEARDYKETKPDDDVREIINYRVAVKEATGWLSNRPMTIHMIRSVHAILMDSVRGQNKNPGRIRVDQNFF